MGPLKFTVTRANANLIAGHTILEIMADAVITIYDDEAMTTPSVIYDNIEGTGVPLDDITTDATGEAICFADNGNYWYQIVKSAVVIETGGPIQITTGGVDPFAIHTNVAAEIDGLTTTEAKNEDLLVAEDSATLPDPFGKFKIPLGELWRGLFHADTLTPNDPEPTVPGPGIYHTANTLATQYINFLPAQEGMWLMILIQSTFPVGEPTSFSYINDLQFDARVGLIWDQMPGDALFTLFAGGKWWCWPIQAVLPA